MAISKEGWVDWARIIPGVPDKVYSEPNKALGLIGHSIVGSWQSAVDRFLSTARDENGRYTRQAAASCMFIITFWGELIQMYPVTASPWTSGGREANTGYWPLEMEGGPIGDESQPLSDLQVMATMRLCEEFEAHTGREVVPGITFREHGEIAEEFGYAPTACPSGRYARFYEAWRARMATIEELAFQVQRLEEIAFGSTDLAGKYHIWWAGDGARLPENALDGRIKQLVAENAALRQELAARDKQIAEITGWIENVGAPALPQHRHTYPAGTTGDAEPTA